MRAAINHHRKEGLCNEIIKIVLPPKSAPRERWLTRSEAAKMIREAWRYQEIQSGKANAPPHSRRHIARFMLVALYTGTRSGAICGAAIRPAIGHQFLNLVEGVLYRRAPGKKENNKRQPPVRYPDRLLVHMRRWERLGISESFVIELAVVRLRGWKSVSRWLRPSISRMSRRIF